MGEGRKYWKSTLSPSLCAACCVHVFSVMSDSFVTPWTVTNQAPLSMEFSRQEYWSGVPFLPPGDLPDPGIRPMCLVYPPLADSFFTS